MWLFAMFDLPVGTRAERRAAARFRKDLQKEGFCMLQFSVYARYCVSEEVSNAISKRVEGFLPDDGQVRLLMVTERQFGRQRVFTKGRRSKAENVPVQLMMF
jgi:CRISPR-associated protein Cas2